MTAKLTAKQQRFASEYLIDLNATRAAIRAGYSEKTAKVQASQLLTKLNIKAYVDAHQKAVSKKTVCDAAWLLDHLHAIATAKIGDILTDEGYYKPIKDWPRIWQQMVNGMDIQRADIGEAVKVEMKKVKLMDRNAVLEKIGKHINVAAFNDKGDGLIPDDAVAAFFNRLPDTTGLPDPATLPAITHEPEQNSD